MKAICEFRIRQANPSDIPELRVLIEQSVRHLQKDDYSSEQIEGALGHALGLDTQLIDDGTYFVAEPGDSLHFIVGCGGWSNRKTLFGSDHGPNREMALLALTRTLAAIHGQIECPSCARATGGRAPKITPPPHADAKKMTDEVFAYYDARRGVEWGDAYEAAGARLKAGDLAGAVEAYARVLAHDPFDGRRAEMADAFAAYGESLLRSNPSRAAALLREARLLDPKSDRARRGEAQLQLAQATRRQSAGQDDAEAFLRALDLDPNLDEARRALAGIESRKQRRAHVQALMFGAVGVGVFVGLVALGLLIWSLFRPKARGLDATLIP